MAHFCKTPYDFTHIFLTSCSVHAISLKCPIRVAQDILKRYDLHLLQLDRNLLKRRRVRRSSSFTVASINIYFSTPEVYGRSVPARVELTENNRKKFLSVNMHTFHKKTLVCLFVFAVPLTAGTTLTKGTVNQLTIEKYDMRSVINDNYSCSTNTGKCIRKCCKTGYYVEVKESLCVKQEEYADLKIPVYKQKKFINDTPGYFSEFVTGFMKCPFYLLDPANNESDNFYIQDDGRMMLGCTILNNDEFCVDIVSGKNLSGFVCFPVKIGGVMEISTYMYKCDLCKLPSVIFYWYKSYHTTPTKITQSDY